MERQRSSSSSRSNRDERKIERQVIGSVDSMVLLAARTPRLITAGPNRAAAAENKEARTRSDDARYIFAATYPSWFGIVDRKTNDGFVRSIDRPIDRIYRATCHSEKDGRAIDEKTGGTVF